MSPRTRPRADERTRPRAWVVAVATAALAVVLGARAATGAGAGYLDVLTLGLAVAGLATAYALCRGGCVEARVLAVLLAVGAGLGVLLAVTVGSPGEAAHGVGWGDAAVLLLAVVIPLTVLRDRRRNGRGTPR